MLSPEYVLVILSHGTMLWDVRRWEGEGAPVDVNIMECITIWEIVGMNYKSGKTGSVGLKKKKGIGSGSYWAYIFSTWWASWAPSACKSLSGCPGVVGILYYFISRAGRVRLCDDWRVWGVGCWAVICSTHRPRRWTHLDEEFCYHSLYTTISQVFVGENGKGTDGFRVAG